MSCAAPYFGYQRHPEQQAVLITYRCRRLCSVRGADRVEALLRELSEEDDSQQVLARWSAELSTEHSPNDRHGTAA